MQKLWFVPLALLYLAVIFSATSNRPLEGRTPALRSRPVAVMPGPTAVIKTHRTLPFGPAAPEDPKISVSRKFFFDALGAKLPRRAARLLAEAVHLDPSFESARERLAQLKLEQGDPDGARAEASACLNLNPRNWGCHRSYIEALVAQDGEDQALVAVRECVAARPGTASSYCLKRLREYYLKGGSLEEFEGVMRDAFAGSGRDPAYEARLQASFYEEVGDSSRAQASYTEACEAGDSYACLALEGIRKG